MHRLTGDRGSSKPYAVCMQIGFALLFLETIYPSIHKSGTWFLWIISSLAIGWVDHLGLAWVIF